MSEVIHASQGYVEKTARTIAAEEVAKVIADAPQNLDTLREIADYIESDKTGAAQIVNRIDANAKAISAEEKRAKDAETALGEAMENGLEPKRDRTNNIAAADSVEFTDWKFHCEVPEIQAALDANPPVLIRDEGDGSGTSYLWFFDTLPNVDGFEIAKRTSDEPYDENATSVHSSACYLASDGRDVAVTATRERIVLTKSGEPYVTPTGVKAIVSETVGSAVDAIPKYEFVIGSLKQEEDSYFVILEPYHCTVLNGKDLSWPYFKVEAGGGSGKVRDFMLVVDLTSMEDPPTITWGANFHPRTDKDTDFKCEAGVRNIYWITEYAEGEFCVAGWQETAGGAS